MDRLNPLLVMSLVLVPVLAVGCSSNESEIDPDPTEIEHAYQAEDGHATFDHMVDAAVMADMTVADYHFVPRRAILTPLGMQRVARLADIIDEYGGEVRFNTRETDESLIAERSSAISTALQKNGLDPSSSHVTLNIPGSIGMDAREAILIRTFENVYVPGQNQSSGPSGSSTGAPPLSN